MFTFFKNCQIQSERKEEANAARQRSCTQRKGIRLPNQTCSPGLLTGLLQFCHTYLQENKIPDAPSFLHSSRSKERAQHRAQGWKGQRFMAGTAATRSCEKKEYLGSAASRQRFFQYDSTPSVPFSQDFVTKYFQISQSFWDQNEQVLWFINCDLKYCYSSHSFGIFVGIGNRQKTAVDKLMGLKYLTAHSDC